MGKYDALRDILAGMGRVAVAFSGGVDSTLLLAAAHDALGDDAWAFTAASQLFPARETAEAQAFCRERGIRQVVFDTHPLDAPDVRRNGEDRCYHCKRRMFEALREAMKGAGFDAARIVEGSNLDDLGDFRPGRRAVEEAGVASPLLQAGLTKAEIRAISQELGLPTWGKPSFACLASRIPHGCELTADALARVDAAEQALFGLGFTQLRVRAHGDVARIEVPPEDFARFADEGIRAAANAAVREAGFTFVAADLAGYKTGNMNPKQA